MTLFDCASLFAESMSEKFSKSSDDSAIFMVATNGKHLAYLVEGSDELSAQMIANLAIMEEEARSVVGEGLLRAINYLKEHRDDTADKTAE